MTLLNVKAKNHPQQVGRRGADDATDDRRTPDELWESLHERFQFTMDVAASAANTKCPAFYDVKLDGLTSDWYGSIWCNPPYSDLNAWVRKAWQEMQGDDDCRSIVMLVPANRTEQKWWQQCVEPHRDGRTPGNPYLTVRFLAGRLRFNRPGWTKPTKGDRPPFGLCLLIWERDV